MDQTESLKSYLELLPNEILIQILRHLSTLDILGLCKANPGLEYFLEEKAVIEKVDLSKKAGFKRVPSFSSLVKKFRGEFITVFNIAYVYWVPAEEIRRSLKTLKNLQELHVVGTKIGISKADCESYGSIKLKKLAVNIDDKDLDRTKVKYFKSVQSLCIQIVAKEDHTFQYRLQCFIKDLNNLKELWIHDVTNSFPLDYWLLAHTGNSLRRFCFKALCSLFGNSPFFGFTKVYFSDRAGREGYFEKFDTEIISPLLLANSSAWKIYDDLHAQSPYGLEDAKKLMYGETNINEIMFKELNFMHSTNHCCPRYISASRDIISSKNTKQLKKLTLSNCFFIDKPLPICDDNPKKRKKFDHNEPLSEEHAVIVNNLKALEVLEIYACAKYEGFRVYYLIQHLENLTQLSLEVPDTLNGEFLRLMFEKCIHLESLKINLDSSNEGFNLDMCRYVALAKNLKNLRYKHYRISLENFFHGLSEMKSPKMESLFLKCKTVDNFGVVYLNKFLKRNPTLEFMVLIINSATASSLRLLTNQMKIFKTTPEKIYMAKKDEKIYTKSFPIPDFYKYELMSPHSTVANIDIFDEFYKSQPQ